MLLASASVQAAPVSSHRMDYCTKSGSLLAAIIGIRDRGSPPEFAAKVIHSYGDMSPLTGPEVQQAIRIAYTSPVFLTFHQGTPGALSMALTNSCLNSPHPYRLLNPQSP